MVFRAGKINLDNLFKAVKNLNENKKIEFISEQFIGIPYKKNSLIGSCTEEEILTVDFEGVDCMTFIEYVEALRVSHNFFSFLENLKKVRYFNGEVDFKKRRHFFTDWNELETVKNITSELSKQIKTVVKQLNKDNEKPLIEGLDVKTRQIQYIPSELIDRILPELKTGDYCGFYTSRNGLDVNHVGIIITNNDTINLRHASFLKGLVVEENFLEYTRKKEGIIVFRAKQNVTF